MDQSSNRTDSIGLVFPKVGVQPGERAARGANSQPTELQVAAFPWWKRGLDLVIVVLALPLLLPLMLGIALLIRLVSRGSVLFKQERVGFKRRHFFCYKFRTMAFGADSKPHEAYLEKLIQSNKPMTKMDETGDPRLIPFGAFLRATGLDELPQLINVVRGEMSVVGPRPCIVYEFNKFSPAYHPRFNTPPGLTGLWQVSGKNRTTFTEMMRLDIQYVRHRSLGLDFRIMFRTFAALYLQAKDLRDKMHHHPNRPFPLRPLIHCACCPTEPEDNVLLGGVMNNHP
jgi:exopolysaccharide production protein ExoY